MSLPLVLLHGWGVRENVWGPLRAELHDLSILTPPLQAGDSLAAWADALAQTLPPACVLGGWSLGAMLAMCLAQRHPQRVRGLLLFAPTPRFVNGEGWQHGLDAETVQAFRDAFQRDAQRTQQRFLALQALGDEARPAVTQHLQAALADPVGMSAPLAQGLRLLATSDLRQARPAANLRTLIIHGENDALIPVTAGRWLAEGWSGSRILTLPGCGHAPFLSRPQEVAREVQKFMDSIGG